MRTNYERWRAVSESDRLGLIEEKKSISLCKLCIERTMERKNEEVYPETRRFFSSVSQAEMEFGSENVQPVNL